MILDPRESVWERMSVRSRVKLVTELGLSGQLGSKAWIFMLEQDKVVIGPALKTPKRKVRHYLMWVGSKYYPTMRHYAAEATALGVCKRVGKALVSVTPGQSLLFLAHDEGNIEDAAIFGYCTLMGQAEATEEQLENEHERAREQRLKLGGIYLLSQRNEFMALDPLRRFSSFFEPVARFQGAMRVYIDTVKDILYTEDPDDLQEWPEEEEDPRVVHRQWSERTDEALLEAVTGRGRRTMKAVFARFARETGHSKTKIRQMWRELEARMEEED
ncbi:hypothetical protein LCGC14_0897580 [marine sediment metagenome]|uniref:Uncharacterized protein n=1 Tax=marine sediment metagenome TaxID=412755 RepID=A0A0F9PI78_9ZZZZ